MHFEAPWLWLAVPLLLAWVWWLGRHSYAQMGARSRWLSLGLRALMMTALVAVLTRPSWVERSGRHHVLFLLDLSRSVSPENMDAALVEVDRVIKAAMEGDHRVSVIGFGRQARVLVAGVDAWEGWPEEARERARHLASLPELYAKRTQTVSDASGDEERQKLEARIAGLEQFQEEVIGDTTDLRGALRLALNTGDVGEARAIYLVTDANFNRGEWMDALTAAAGRGGSDQLGAEAMPVHVIAMDRPIPPEVAAADLIAPSGIRVNQGFSADLHVASTVACEAKVAVYKDGFASAELSVTLKPGDNAITIPGLYFRDKGFHTLDVAVRAAQDTQVENNIVKSLVIVPGEARVLYVDGDEALQSYLKSALELEGMQVESRPAAGVPQTLAELLGYDAFILSNVPADKVSMRQMQMIRTYVQDFGGGFIMLGGEESFGLGGYYNTPIEEVLPVTMPIQKDMLRPGLAIVLVIDKSGSMDGAKIQLAKRAAIATSEVINPRDQIGVVGFDGDSRVILELTSASDRATISAAIAGLEAGGGTFLYPAIEDAHERLTQSNARRKHVIILSDGQTQGFGYGEIAQMLAADGITISTVGIGEGADMRLMEEIAASGGGRAYFTSDFHSIPQIFTREALRASKSMLVERLVQPILEEDDEALEELDTEELPPLNGYVATTPKAASKVILISDSGDPLLAKWRYGLGRSAAFTSDTKPRWAEDWIRWPDFAKFWTQVVRSVAGQELAESVSVDVRHEPLEEGVRMTVDLRDAAGNFLTDRALELTSYDAQAKAQKLDVRHDAPGLFSAIVPRITYGQTQQFAWSMPDPDGESLTVPFGYVYSFSPEFRSLGVNEEALRQIEERGIGQIWRMGKAEVALGEGMTVRRIALWPYLLMAALLLAPLDILVRRFA
jgi:Ca-activated chloride channel homolog